MNIFKPGNSRITKEAADIVGIKKGDKVLDVGCGEGDSLAFLEKEYKIKGIGIDKSSELIKKGKDKYKNIKLQKGDADFLDFSSLEFDAVFLECALSVMDMQEEVLHEIYCVLKQGGKLVITDLYNKKPDKKQFEKAREEALKIKNTPREEGSCGDITAPSEFMLDGAFVLESLIEACGKMGYEVIFQTDKSNELSCFIAEILLEYGSIDEYFNNVVPEGQDKDCFCKAALNKKDIGYFLLVLNKK